MSGKDWSGNTKSIFVCNGASNHTEEERQTDDYYATEPKNDINNAITTAINEWNDWRGK